MQSHLRLQLREAPSHFPHWQDVALGKTHAPDRLHPDLDPAFDRHHLPVKVTQEYRSAQANWSATELASGLNRIYRVIGTGDRPFPPSLVAELTHHPAVEAAKIGEIGQSELPAMMSAPMDATAFGNHQQGTQGQQKTDERSRQAIYLSQAHHHYSQGNPDIVVAVLDTGIDLDHPELQAALLPGYDFVNIISGAGRFVGDFLGYDTDADDEVGHGTHVAGIIAAQGIAMPLGVVPRCKILPVRGF
jgi:subtilisin family serine protease